MEIATKIQMLGAYPLPFYQHFTGPKYVELKDLFPPIPEIKEIEQISGTREDIERRKLEREKSIRSYLRIQSNEHLIFKNKEDDKYTTTKSMKEVGSLLDIIV
ncbi:MAG: hypothetical protein ISS82_00910 [Nanoarchaeota archaeon]|nr:hypothetical protein [Nanoarchaeota archaeon]